MRKPFFEVFQTLDLSDTVQSLFEFVQVERVTMNRERNFMRIYLESEKLIHKKYVYEIEQAIKDQLFSDVSMTIKIIEKFRLSKQYTARKLIPVYEDSILLELKNYNALLYSLLKESEKIFSDEHTLCLRMPDTVIADGKEKELLEILEKIFCERCGLDFHVSTERMEPKKNKKREMQEKELEQEVAAILQNYESVKEEENRQKSDTQQETKKAGQLEKTAASNSGNEKSKDVPKKKSSFYQSGDRFSVKRSDNPDVVYGRDFDGEPITIDSINGEIGSVILRGQVLSVEQRELRIEKTLFMFNITDFTDSIGIKMFVKNEQAQELAGTIKAGAFLKISGVTTIDRFDSQLTIGNIMGVKKIPDFREKRLDTYPEKRVELHCHTKMSDMDGVAEAKDIVKQAYRWGHPAIAITDHGAVQAFPDANHVIEDIDGAYRKKYQQEHPEATKADLKKVADPFKVIYGVEALSLIHI